MFVFQSCNLYYSLQSVPLCGNRMNPRMEAGTTSSLCLLDDSTGSGNSPNPLKALSSTARQLLKPCQKAINRQRPFLASVGTIFWNLGATKMAFSCIFNNEENCLTSHHCSTVVFHVQFGTKARNTWKDLIHSHYLFLFSLGLLCSHSCYLEGKN